MNKKELFNLAKDGDWDKIIEDLFSGVPYAFKKAPPEYDKVKVHLGTALKISATSITLVGSGRFGFSLAPYKFGRPFNERSDLDFVIVDSNLFDAAWLELIQYDFKSLSLEGDLADSLWEHRRNHIFWGYIEPYSLKVALSFYSKTWFPAFASLGFFTSIGGRQVKARVYRTWEHARNYHHFGLRMLVAQNVGEKQ